MAKKSHYLTVSDLRKALKGLKGNTPVYVSDHDHGKYETISKAYRAEKLNQEEADPWDEVDEDFKIEGDYFVVSG